MQYTIDELKQFWYHLGKNNINIPGHPELVKLFRSLSPEIRTELNEEYRRARSDLDIANNDFSQFQGRKYTLSNESP